MMYDEAFSTQNFCCLVLLDVVIIVVYVLNYVDVPLSMVTDKSILFFLIVHEHTDQMQIYLYAPSLREEFLTGMGGGPIVLYGFFNKYIVYSNSLLSFIFYYFSVF